MEGIQGPNGVRYEGNTCFKFCSELASDAKTYFELEDVHSFGDRATIQW
jgi:hypothetical protein